MNSKKNFNITLDLASLMSVTTFNTRKDIFKSIVTEVSYELYSTLHYSNFIEIRRFVSKSKEDLLEIRINLIQIRRYRGFVKNTEISV